jgi:hypothetical protein
MLQSPRRVPRNRAFRRRPCQESRHWTQLAVKARQVYSAAIGWTVPP